MKIRFTFAIILLALAPASLFSAESGGSPFSREEVEERLSKFYTAAARDALDESMPGKHLVAWVSVELASKANLQDLAVSPSSEFAQLPGMIGLRSEGAVEEARWRKMLGLPQKKNVTVVSPSGTTPEAETVLGGLLRKRIHLAATDQLVFRSQTELLKEAPTDRKDPKDPKEQKAQKEQSETPMSWTVVIIGLAVIAGLALLFFALSRRRADSMGKAGAASPSDSRSGSSSEPRALDSQEGPSHQIAELRELVHRIGGIDPEVGSIAFSHLASRPDLRDAVAAAVQGIGIDHLLSSFPRVSSEVWSQIGEAMSGSGDSGAGEAELLALFRRQFASEVARVQKLRGRDKLLPKLEAKSPSEILRSLKSSRTEDLALAMAALPDHLLPTLIGAMSSGDLLRALQSLARLESAKVGELKRLDQLAESGSSPEAEVELEALQKLATALGAVNAAEEFRIAEQLLRQQPHLLAGIASYRLLPQHLSRLPETVLIEALQSRDLEEIKQVVSAVGPETRTRLSSLLTDKQRAIVGEGDESGQGSPEALRSFLAEIHARYFLGRPQAAAELLGLGYESQPRRVA